MRSCREAARLLCCSGLRGRWVTPLSGLRRQSRLTNSPKIRWRRLCSFLQSGFTDGLTSEHNSAGRNCNLLRKAGEVRYAKLTVRPHRAMNLFELATLLSPVGGAVGGAVAVLRATPPTPAWMWAAIPVGLVCGIGCYYGLVRLAIGGHDRNPDIPGWRIAAIFGISFLAPLIAGVLSYSLFRLVFYVVA